ncbi:MAG: hypothetical protein NZ922_00375 [Candidatus Methanomethyliaceae archaeon]|nr:hypothetical protein [Candidatus Methanomethyliaceae archaeon]MDW7970471.1 ribonuclease VapC [Nitrososphaerota archaeon]
MRVYILDTSAFIHGFNPQLVKGEHYITPNVISELSRSRLRDFIDLCLSLGKLILKSPRHEFIELVRQKANTSGDLWDLSETDLSIIALALELKEEGKDPIIVSDDYGLQNLCSLLSLKFKSMMTEGIKKRYFWLIYCPACGATYGPLEKFCRVCGHYLKRKVHKK